MEAANTGAHAGGSGFIAAVPAAKNHFHLYGVTNRHVIENGASVIRLNTIDGDFDVLALKPTDWTSHNEQDLAVVSIELSPSKHRVHFFQIGGFLTKDSIEEYGIGPGDDTFLVGRFVYADGRIKNEPSVRFGKIAMNPGEPIRQPTGHSQESFLVETHSIGGYSGSPVFVYFLPFGFRTKKRPAADIRDVTISLLGVDWGHLPGMWKPINDSKGKPHPDGWGTKQNTGMMGVVPAWHIVDLLNDEVFVEKREQEDEKLNEVPFEE